MIRDYSGSYPYCIHFQTLCIFACCLAWVIEVLYRQCCSSDEDTPPETPKNGTLNGTKNGVNNDKTKNGTTTNK